MYFIRSVSSVGYDSLSELKGWMDLITTYRRPSAFFTWWEKFHDIFLYIISYLHIG